MGGLLDLTARSLLRSRMHRMPPSVVRDAYRGQHSQLLVVDLMLARSLLHDHIYMSTPRTSMSWCCRSSTERASRSRGTQPWCESLRTCRVIGINITSERSCRWPPLNALATVGQGGKPRCCPGYGAITGGAAEVRMCARPERRTSTVDLETGELLGVVDLGLRHVQLGENMVM